MTPTASAAYRANRNKLLISCATIALMAAQPAKAQVAPSGAFQGSITGQTGSVTRAPATGTETITIGTPTATINWSPTDKAVGTGTPIDFLPSGNKATFTSASGVTDYTVLNRIVPTDPNRPIALNGSVVSTLQGTETVGGKVWFYSPGGIIIGATAVFDVGGLLLTTADLPNGFTADASGFSGSFSAPNAASTVQIQSGARITAPSAGSYVAIIAPRIEQGGSVRVNGSAAYIAAQQMTMTFSQGLFDVSVDVGTDDPEGIVHTGTTGGPANTVDGDNHTIYMAAVPKNQALTMLLSGTIGFDPATDASVENGQIVLSAGGSSGIDDVNYFLRTPDTESDAAMDINGGRFTSPVWAIANSDLTVETLGTNLTFDRDVILQSENGSVIVSANNEHTLGFGGMLTIYADDVLLRASNEGMLEMDGPTYIFAVADSSGAAVDGDAADIHGGTINVEADGGTILTNYDVSLNAYAFGQDNEGGGDLMGGDGTGGDINVYAANGGKISIDGNLEADADGYGGNMLDGSTAGGTGTGGNIHVSVDDASLTVTGDTNLTAEGNGGDYEGEGTPEVALGGTGRGGFVSIYSGGPGTIDLQGAVSLEADGFGGYGQTGGAGYGQSAGISGIGGTIKLGSETYISALGFGGDALYGSGGDGGYGRGGTAYIEARANTNTEQFTPTAATIIGGDVDLDVSGWGGTGGAGDGEGIAPGAGGDGQGGFYQGEAGTGGAFAASDNPGGSLSLGYVDLESDGFGGEGGGGFDDTAGGPGGSGLGGSVQVGNYDTSGTGARTASTDFTSLYMSASGYGGSGGFPANGANPGAAGAASGGTAYIIAKGHTNVGDANVYVDSTTGDFGTGEGGWIDLESFDGSTLVADFLALSSSGDASLNVDSAGALSVTDTLLASATGDVSVGNADAGFAAIDAGGTANFYGTLSAPEIDVSSSDINIAAGASLGVQGVTGTIVLGAVSDSPIVIGEVPEGAVAPTVGGYRLDEDGDIHTDSLFIYASSPTGETAPDIVIYNTHIDGSASEGGGVSNVLVQTDSSIRVEGVVDWADAGDSDQLWLFAGNRIEIDTDTGGIAMTGPGEQYAGTLMLMAPDVWAADGSLLAQLEQDPNFAGRDEALATNNGPVVPDGYLRAGSITAWISDSFFVQNSGTVDDLAGLTVGDGGLAIFSSAADGGGEVFTAVAPVAAVDIYGRQVTSTGETVTGDAFAAIVSTFGDFTEDSTINNAPLGAAPPPPDASASHATDSSVTI